MTLKQTMFGSLSVLIRHHSLRFHDWASWQLTAQGLQSFIKQFWKPRGKPFIRKWELCWGDCTKRGGLLPPPTAQQTERGQQAACRGFTSVLVVTQAHVIPGALCVFGTKSCTSRCAVSDDRVSPSVKNVSLHPLPDINIHYSAACCCFLLLPGAGGGLFYDDWLVTKLMTVNWPKQLSQ